MENYLNIDGAQIFYREYGIQNTDKIPVLLIHGSTITGEIDWSGVVPRLSEKFHVFVPDCRGHGLSTNPSGQYSFKRMAQDNVEFVHALGYEKMHVVGHSNGGNVALVTVAEYPEICQTAVVQAANAYVTDYLREREPIVLDPDYYATHHPEDVAEMIAAHAQVHGKEYWRDLLVMTMHEIISEPNYTKEDLARIKVPVLSVMGSDDRVNAPDRHAQFIAENISGAELWIPDGIGHSVHHEIPEEWCARIMDFLLLRGS